jgi:hypothetical protein
MKKLLLAAALTLVAGVSPALAQMCSTDAAGNTICDPTAFHVTSSTATGSDPVLLNDSNTFTIDLVGNHTINQPLHILFIEAPGTPLSITSASGVEAGGTAFSFGATATSAQRAFDLTNGLFDGPDVTISTGQDLAKQINLNGGDTSLSYANFLTAFAANHLTLPTTFDVFDAVFPVSFDSNADFITLNGNFGLGTIIAPLALDITTGSNGKLDVTVFDTSWTNAGVVNQLSTAVPEAPTWVMFFLGFIGISYAARRGLNRQRHDRLRSIADSVVHDG